MLALHDLLGVGVGPEEGHVFDHLLSVVSSTLEVLPAPLLRLLALLVGIGVGEGVGGVQNSLKFNGRILIFDLHSIIFTSIESSTLFRIMVI